jgi:hypothetical protein
MYLVEDSKDEAFVDTAVKLRVPCLNILGIIDQLSISNPLKKD